MKKRKRNFARFFAAVKIRRLAGLINTSLQRGDCRLPRTPNRFNGFHPAQETVETAVANTAALPPR